MFSGGRIVFIIVSLIVLFLLAFVVFKTEKPVRWIWLKAGSALIFGGAIGNMISALRKAMLSIFWIFGL